MNHPKDVEAPSVRRGSSPALIGPNRANLALSTVSVILALIAVEVGLRLYAGIDVFQVTNFIGDQVDQLRTRERVVYDERLGWATKPDVHERFYNTGAYGIRLADKVDRPVPQGAILVSGSSFAFGEEVDDNESWPADLEAMTGIPVINAASPAWSPDQVVVRIEDMLAVAHPKTIILGLVWHDAIGAEKDINFGAEKPYYTVEAGALVLHNEPVPRAGPAEKLGWVRSVVGYSYAVFWVAQRLNLNGWLYAGYADGHRATPPGTGEQITCLLMKRLSERAVHDGIRLILVMQYHYQDFAAAQSPLSKAILECAADAGVETIDTWRRLAEVYGGDPARFDSLFNRGPGSHMSPAGNRFVAAEIATKVQPGD